MKKLITRIQMHWVWLKIVVEIKETKTFIDNLWKYCQSTYVFIIIKVWLTTPRFYFDCRCNLNNCAHSMVHTVKGDRTTKRCMQNKKKRIIWILHLKKTTWRVKENKEPKVIHQRTIDRLKMNVFVWIREKKPDLIHCFIIWACDRNKTLCRTEHILTVFSLSTIQI